MEGLTKPPASALLQNLSPSIFGWKDKPSHSRVSRSKFKPFYLLVEGRTKSLTSALVKILSPTTHGWKHQPSRPRVPWYKILVLLPTSGRTNQVTHECLGENFKSYYLRVEGLTKPPTSALVQNLVLLPTGGRTKQVTHECFGRSLKSYYLQVEGLTKPPVSALLQNLSPSIFGWKDEPSHSRVPW